LQKRTATDYAWTHGVSFRQQNEQLGKVEGGRFLAGELHIADFEPHREDSPWHILSGFAI
jgi:hypothetical protein